MMVSNTYSMANINKEELVNYDIRNENRKQSRGRKQEMMQHIIIERIPYCTFTILRNFDR